MTTTNPTSIPITAAFSLISTLIEKIGPIAVEAWYLRDSFHQIKEDMIEIKAVTLDAEEQLKTTNSHEIRLWLDKLYTALREAEDLVDVFATEDLSRLVRTRNKFAKDLRIFFSLSNKSVFNFKMFREVRKVVKLFSDLNIGRRVFNFTANIPNQLVISHRDTHPSIPTKNFIGREDVKNELIRLVLNTNIQDEIISHDNFTVISIVGIGGLGKTALAQLIFSNPMVANHFEFKEWVSVADDVSGFHDTVIAANIAGCDASSNKRRICQKLDAKIKGKKSLIILDDVWNENQELWFHFKALLANIGKGSKIIITTRSLTVAKVTGTTQSSTFILKGLDDNESWVLFCRNAFQGKENEPNNSEMVGVGKEIVSRCVGVPLAIRVVGALMKDMTVREWLTLKDKDLVKIDEQGENSIFPLIKLSYDNLPFNLKKCFISCCLFEKGSEIDAIMLIRLWVSQGFILPSSDESISLENEGEKYLWTLLNRSFFQDVKINKEGNISSFKAHDLMYDLATSVSNYEFVLIDPTKQRQRVEKQTLHISFPETICSSSASWRDPNSFLVADKLRTFFSPNQYHRPPLFDKLLTSNFTKLRMLTVRNLGTRKVPSCIGKLKHLRYLDISHSSQIQALPNSITKLLNLETLILNGCALLRKWPKHMSRLTSLRHLEFLGTNFTTMPHGIGKLTSLQTVSNFFMGKASELGELNNLTKRLTISNMEHLRQTPTDAEKMRLILKSHLEVLELDWTLPFGSEDDGYRVVGYEMDDQILQGISLHPNTKRLLISGFCGAEITSSVGFFSNLNELHLQYFPSLQYLPPSIFKVKCLHLDVMYCLESIVNCNNNCISSSPFSSSIEEVTLSVLPNLKGWCACSEEEVARGCHPVKLDYLYIGNCRNLVSIPQESKVRKLVLSFVGHKLLEEVTNHVKVDILVLRNIDGLKSLAGCLPHLTTLSELHLLDCRDLDPCNDEHGCYSMQWQHLEKLKMLKLFKIPHLEYLPDGLQHVDSLQGITVKFCDRFQYVPEWAKSRLELIARDFTVPKSQDQRFNPHSHNL